MELSWRRSIKKKLMFLFTANTTTALILACIVFWICLASSLRKNLVEEQRTVARMLAESVSPALAFQDRKGATEILAVLRAEPRLMSACVFDRAGQRFAAYISAEKPSGCAPPAGRESYRFERRSLDLLAPVTLDHEVIGELRLRVDLSEMYTQLARFGLIGMAVLLAAMLLAFLLSAQLQRLISDPILHLTHIAGQVSLDGNYSIRALRQSDDETGVLIAQFNSMMEQIHHRDLKLQKAQDELEARVDARTLELQKEIAEREVIQQDLVNAKLAAEESNRAKSTFLANMSHELRTPLNAILGYSEMLEEDATAAGDADAAADLRRIQAAGRHLLMLINDVLDLSKIEAGRMELSLEPVRVAAIINEVAATTIPLARKNDNRFETFADDWDRIVHVDVVKFRQCLLNLLSNACKFTERGKITLSVRQISSAAGERICWEVSDTGMGIAPKDQAKLFHAFSQVDSSATRKHGGTGLGLAISQRLIQVMGGSIRVTTAPGAGSTFIIDMPLYSPPQVAAADAAVPEVNRA